MFTSPLMKLRIQSHKMRTKEVFLAGLVGNAKLKT